MMLLLRCRTAGQTSISLAMLTQTIASSMSTHHKILLRAGLVTTERDVREVVYRIDNGGAGAGVGAGTSLHGIP